MSTTAGEDEPNSGHVRDQAATVGWQDQHPIFRKSAVWPISRGKSDAERAAAHMFRMAEKADNPEDVFNNFERAAKLCREYGIQVSPPEPPNPGGGPTGHRARMDAARIAITVLLILGVLAITGWSLASHNAGTAAQYVAPVSGLAGIGLGWLFTNQQSPPSTK